MDPDLLGNLLDQHAAWLPTRSRPARWRKPSRPGSRPSARRGPRLRSLDTFACTAYQGIPSTHL
jgi:hypothetical protein